VSEVTDPATDRWRDALVALGFADDGEHLRGAVSWQHPECRTVTARVCVTPMELFPFAPPVVRVLNPGAEVEFTFHIDLEETLCLWEDDWAVDEAPWRDPQVLLARIAGWLEKTAARWPDDNVCDLERYVARDDATFVLYDAAELPARCAVRTVPGPNAQTIRITAECRRIGDLRGNRSGRKSKDLAWVDDLGAIDRPLRSWQDVAHALGPNAGEVARLINFGAVKLLLLRYRRGGSSSALALRVRRAAQTIEISACESADTSQVTRAMRAGPHVDELRDIRIAIVGCGAIGSFAADYLFRAGARRLTLRDGERLRPGNVVRHLAGLAQVGLRKVDAIRACFEGVDPDVSGVLADPSSLFTLDDALALVRDHDVVLDATGNARASSLLASAVEGVGAGHSVVSVCVQRDGDVLRVDRLPLRGAEQHLAALPLLDDKDHPREHGCGSPVSPTPPGAVVAAAELAHRVVIDEATHACTLPATLAVVRRAQPEPPFDTVGPVSGRGGSS
jgi:hypothetical protein